MLLHIKGAAAGPERIPACGDPLTLLQSCHQRIRHFSALALRLAHPPLAGTDPAELAEAAAAVLRYFQVGLPLHVLDEDESVAPRLASAGLAHRRPGLAEALSRLAQEHIQIEAAVAGAAPLWQALAAAPARQPALAQDLRVHGTLLDELFQRHLAEEEAMVFPALTQLSLAVLAEIVQDIRGRRTG